MTRTHPHRVPQPGWARCCLVWLAASGVAASLVAWLASDLLAHASTSLAMGQFDAVLVVACEAAALVGVPWLWLLVSLVTLDAVRGLERRRPGVPALVRRGVLLACGLGLAGGLTPAYADASDRSASPRVGATSVVVGLQLPDRTTARHRSASTAPAAPREHGVPSRTVVVSPGDTLWDLAVADLPQGADVALVAAHWRAIHAANRAVIGPDPDLILPGQRLRLPRPPSP